MAWSQVEDQISEQNDLVIIGCQTLDRLTGGYYPADFHRVINSISRKSIVYKLRGKSIDFHEISLTYDFLARSDALLDMKGLNSPVLENAFRSFTSAIKVEDWIKNELQYEQSVNFPGASLENYKNCILDPSLNTSVEKKFGRENLETSAAKENTISVWTQKIKVFLNPNRCAEIRNLFRK